MKLREIAKKTEKEQQKLLEEKREKLRQLRFALTTGKVKNVREVRTLRKDIARILTFLGKDSKKKKKIINK